MMIQVLVSRATLEPALLAMENQQGSWERGSGAGAGAGVWGLGPWSPALGPGGGEAPGGVERAGAVDRMGHIARVLAGMDVVQDVDVPNTGLLERGQVTGAKPMRSTLASLDSTDKGYLSGTMPLGG